MCSGQEKKRALILPSLTSFPGPLSLPTLVSTVAKMTVTEVSWHFWELERTAAECDKSQRTQGRLVD